MKSYRLLLSGAMLLGAVAILSAQLPLTPPEEGKTPVPVEGKKLMMIKVTSDSIKEGQAIDKKFSSEGDDASPKLNWSNLPPGTQELVVMMEDPDGSGGNFSHWLMYSIPKDVTSLPENLPKKEEIDNPKGAMQGKNSFVKIGYGGPLPWPGTGVHHYQFRVFALDKKLGLKPGLYKEDVQKAMYGHVIGQGMLIGTYERK